MRRVTIGLALCVVFAALPAAQIPYYPPPGQWAHKPPVELGFDPAKLNEAVEFMKSNETRSSHDLVVVWRWSGAAAQGFQKVVAAITS